MQEREQFGSRLGFILVSAGCAVGLGNVWKFPYICGQYGGAAFILIYLICLLALGLPILICEFAVGRSSQRSIATAFYQLEKKGSGWHHYKWIGVVGNYMLMMFYTMVGGWMLFYAWRMISGRLKGLNGVQVSEHFTDMLGSAGTMTGWMVVVVIIAFGICALGLKNGVERITKVMMSALLILMIIMAIHSMTLGEAREGLRFYLIPNFQNMVDNGVGNVIFAAMSHAFFTLSVGIGAMEIFGSYLKKDNCLLGEAVNVLVLDTFVALVAGLIIIPACFAYGVQPDAGPSLLFVTLPNVFNQMAGGQIWGTCFFVFMSFAALSTIIAVFENIISMTMEIFQWTRKKAVICNFIGIIVLSLPAVLGYNVLGSIEPLGVGSTIMDLEDFIVSYNILPLGSLLFVLFCVKKNGWGFHNFLAEVNTGKGRKMSAALQPYMTYVVPCIIMFIYLKGYYDMFCEFPKKQFIAWMIIGVIFLILILGISMIGSKKEHLPTK